ncbi:hypothetical protein ABZ649_04450 [Streptomyces albidoflavus]|uniref:hypothetical protein n=1 Tax=Streptomyces albidoflavus TaxID=1886 RepID=UPI0033EECB4D
MRTYDPHDAADPALYVQLLEERYGPLQHLLRERSAKPRSGAEPTPDPDGPARLQALANALGAPIPTEIRNRAAA